MGLLWASLTFSTAPFSLQLSFDLQTMTMPSSILCMDLRFLLLSAEIALSLVGVTLGWDP